MTLEGANVSWSEGNVSYFQLNKLFKQYGATEVNMKNALPGCDGGRAFIKFKTQNEAEFAVQQTNGHKIGNSIITVDLSNQHVISQNL
ncbi:MAG: hypothetical protein EZS28_049140, partial [Streblomastix strix]